MRGSGSAEPSPGDVWIVQLWHSPVETHSLKEFLVSVSKIQGLFSFSNKLILLIKSLLW